jgi:hypothetical protein
VNALRRYGGLLARPGVRSAVVLSVLCRLPMGMTPLAVLLLVRAETGSFATAGLTTGVYAAAVALCRPCARAWSTAAGWRWSWPRRACCTRWGVPVAAGVGGLLVGLAGQRQLLTEPAAA